MSSNSTKKEKSLLEIIHIIYKRKLILISSVIITLILTYIYSQSTAPVYESQALLKKETSDKTQGSNEFYEMLQLQTQDEVETELELVKTGEVLGSVVKELKLYFELNNIVDPNGKSVEMKNVFIDFPDTGNNYKEQLNFNLPKISNLKIRSNEVENKTFFVQKTDNNLFELRNAGNNSLIITSQSEEPQLDIENEIGNVVRDTTDLSKYQKNNEMIAKFSNELLEFDFSWNDAPVGSKVYFEVKNFNVTIGTLSKKVSVSKVGKTNVFAISVRSVSPVAAQVIAGCLIDKYREARIEQQKQTIRYSFKFVDEQLDEIRTKLVEAENNLSSFKASGQIISVDESSRELVTYLSSLEAEKLSTDLLLSDYKNKAEDLKKQLELSGYFDQSFIESSGGRSDNSPFATLLKKVSDLELQRLELLQKRSENHPDVINLDEQIRLAKEKLASYNQNSVTSYQIMINSLEKKLLKINNLMSTYEVRLQMLPSQESQLARLLRQKDVYEKMFTLLLDKREEMRMAEVSKLQDIIVVDPPEVPLKPISPNKPLNMMIAFVLGTFIGLLGIFIIEIKNSNLINLDGLEEDIQLPILAIVPKFSRRIIKRIHNSKENYDKFVTLMDDNSGIRESFRVLKTKLLMQDDRKQNILLVTSCEENSGKTTIVSNLAITFAQENKKVLLIDCDLRKADLSSLFNISIETPGLVDYLVKDIKPVIYTKIMKNIDMIPAGGLREDSAALLDSERMVFLIEYIKNLEYDYIIIDTPPVTRVVDTLVLGRLIKNAVMVVRPQVSFKEAVTAGIQDMKLAKLRIRGVIVNAAEIDKSYLYRYKYGYGYGYAESNGKYSFKGNKRLTKKSKKEIFTN